MSVSEFFILTLHGDRLIYCDCIFVWGDWWEVRSEMPKGTPEMFYRTMQFWEDVNPPPVFVESFVPLVKCRIAMKFTSSILSEIVCTLYFRRKQLLLFPPHFQNNVSPTFYLELLSKIASVLSVRGASIRVISRSTSVRWRKAESVRTQRWSMNWCTRSWFGLTSQVNG